jgi:hypothetical protein
MECDGLSDGFKPEELTDRKRTYDFAFPHEAYF